MDPDPFIRCSTRSAAAAARRWTSPGGTEVGACFLSPLPITPLEACSLGGPALGMDVDVWGPGRAAVPARRGGGVVCKQPWPAMTRGVWGDHERYLDTYWRRWPGVWVHGDWARSTPRFGSCTAEATTR